MTPAEWARRKDLFSQVVAAPTGERDALLARLCAGDVALEADVRRLVANDREDDSLLDHGAAEAVGAKVAGELAAGQVLCERFELLRLAGEGGMGQVWAARDRRLNEAVAIKTIQRGLADEQLGLARFQRELQLARRIGHPNVCRVYELFEDTSLVPPRVFLTMELLEGETLAARLKREGALQAQEALRLFKQIAAGLDAAHAAGVVHRDLKPGNVMLVPGAGGQERAVVMDFGLARAQEAPGPEARTQVTESGVVMGTFEYMAPEQIRGESPTPAVDVYALGLVLFEMLEGRAPFQGRNTMDAWMRRMREGPPKLASSEPAMLAPSVDRVIARCLEYEPSARFASAGEAVAALSMRVAPPPMRWKWPVAVAAGVAALVAGAVWFAPRGLDPVPADARQWYTDAQRDLSEGAAARAAAELRRAIGRAPRFAAAHAALAETLLELDQVFQARESVQRATDAAPDRSRLPVAEALHIEGVNRLILRDCPGATDSLRRRAEAMPAAERPTAMALLARAYERCDMTVEARKTLAAAGAADPRNAAVRVRAAYLASRARETEAAEKLLGEAEALYRERANFEGVGEVLITRGTLAAERDRLDDAAKVLGEAAALAKTTGSVQQQVRVLLQQAIVARKRGELAEAERVTNEGVELARRNDLETLAMQGLFTAANVHFIKNEFDQAEAGFERALEIATRYRDEGNQARAWLSLASMNVRRAVPNKAAEYLAKARPYYEKAGNARVMGQLEALGVQVDLQRGDYPTAESILRHRLERAVNTKNRDLVLDTRRWLLTLMLDLGRWPEALEEIRLIRSTSPRGSTGTLFDALAEAEVLAALGRSYEARQVHRQVERLSTQSPAIAVRVLFVDGIISSYEGRWDAAASSLEKVVTSHQADELTRHHANLRLCQWSPFIRLTKPKGSCNVPEGEDVLRKLLTRLSVVESLFLSGDPGRAAADAALIATAMSSWGNSEWRWRAEVVASVARNSSPMSPKKPDFRLAWTEKDHAGWSERPDIVQLRARLRQLRKD